MAPARIVDTAHIKSVELKAILRPATFSDTDQHLTIISRDLYAVRSELTDNVGRKPPKERTNQQPDGRCHADAFDLFVGILVLQFYQWLCDSLKYNQHLDRTH